MITHKELISKGFIKADDDLFSYEYTIIPEQEVIDNDIDKKELPVLLYCTGNNLYDSGFCLYTGCDFIWLMVNTIDEAFDFISKIKSIEPNF